MRFQETRLKNAFILDVERLEDERGFFGRTWCQREFTDHGLESNLVQCSISLNRLKGTLRGMHLQLPPYAETKLVRCTQGAIFDVIIDLRQDSNTYKEWIGVELTAENRRALYVPKGFAHGFQTLADNTEVLYQMTEFFAPDYARGLLWNDPQFSINWPEPVSIMSAKDQSYESFDPEKLPLTTSSLS